MASLEFTDLPIEIREHILSYIQDISLIPDGLSEGFWKKWFLKHSVDCVMFASWKKSAKIMKDYNGLNEKRKILALLDWKTMYVGTLGDITIMKHFAEYKMEKEVIAAAGRTGLCMLVKPANLEDESYLDITPRSSMFEDHYTGVFSFSGYKPLKERPKKERLLFSPGVTAWYHHNESVNKTFYKVAQSIFKIYDVEYNLQAFRDFGDDEEDDSYYDDDYDEYESGFIVELNDSGEPRESEYMGGYGNVPILSQSLVYTKDPNVFEKPHVIEMFHKKNDICTVKDLNGNLNAFIVCCPTWEECSKIMCMGDQLRYFITDGGNIYFEDSDIYDKYIDRFYPSRN